MIFLGFPSRDGSEGLAAQIEYEPENEKVKMRQKNAGDGRDGRRRRDSDGGCRDIDQDKGKMKNMSNSI